MAYINLDPAILSQNYFFSLDLQLKVSLFSLSSVLEVIYD